VKVERLNDNQIRFVFLAQDLADRNINVHDILTRSANKTQGLFQEITQLLHGEYDFAAIGTPLVFEAKMAHDTLSVLVTKVAGGQGDMHGQPNPNDQYNGANGLVGFQSIVNNMMAQFGNNGYGQDGFMFATMHPGGVNNGQNQAQQPNGGQKPHILRKRPESGCTVFAFENFDMLATAASHIPEGYKGHSHVYKVDGKHNLVLQNVGTLDHSTKKFENKLCEFGQKQPTSPITYRQIQEHGEVIIAEDAISKLKIYLGV